MPAVFAQPPNLAATGDDCPFSDAGLLRYLSLQIAGLRVTAVWRASAGFSAILCNSRCAVYPVAQQFALPTRGAIALRRFDHRWPWMAIAILMCPALGHSAI